MRPLGFSLFFFIFGLNCCTFSYNIFFLNNRLGRNRPEASVSFFFFLWFFSCFDVLDFFLTFFSDFLILFFFSIFFVFFLRFCLLLLFFTFYYYFSFIVYIYIYIYIYKFCFWFCLLMNFMRFFTIWNVLEQFKRQHQKHYENDADELKRYRFFKKSKASVVTLNELNPEPVFGITAMSNSMMIKGRNTIMKERIWINCAVSEIVLQPLEPDTDTSKLHVKRIIAVQEEPSLHVNSTREMSLMKCSSHVMCVMTRSDDTDVGGTSLSRSTERCGARELVFPLCWPIQEVQDCTSESLLHVKGEWVCFLDETEFVSRYKGRQAQQ